MAGPWNGGYHKNQRFGTDGRSTLKSRKATQAFCLGLHFRCMAFVRLTSRSLKNSIDFLPVTVNGTCRQTLTWRSDHNNIALSPKYFGIVPSKNKAGWAYCSRVGPVQQVILSRNTTRKNKRGQLLQSRSIILRCERVAEHVPNDSTSCRRWVHWMHGHREAVPLMIGAKKINHRRRKYTICDI